MRNLLVGTILGMLMGWTLGFLRIPFIEKNESFWVGLVACLAFVLFLIAVLFVWNKQQLLLRLIGKGTKDADAASANSTHSVIWLVVTLLIIGGGLLSSILLYKQNKLLDGQAKYIQAKMEEQNTAMQAIKQNHLVLSVRLFLDKIGEELKSHPGRSLPDASVEKIAALSHSFLPAQPTEGDSLLQRKLSFERGQLLLGLSKMEMDTSAFNKIKRRATFAHADLRKADLSDADLNGADLRKADLWGANLQNTNLNGANMRHADLRWADLKEAVLKKANLNGADLTNAKLLRADLSGATFQWAELGSTLLNEADFSDADLLGANLMQAHLGRINLTGVNLKSVNIEEDWLEKLPQWRVVGADEIPKLYKIVPDKTRLNPLARFRF